MNNTKRIWHMVSKLTGAPLQLPDPLMSVDSGLLAWHIALTSDNKQIQFQHMITFFCFGKGTTEPSITNQLQLQIDWSLVLLLFDHHAHTVHLYGTIREGSGWKSTSWPLNSTAPLLPLIKLKAGNPLCPICTCLIKGRSAQSWLKPELHCVSSASHTTKNNVMDGVQLQLTVKVSLSFKEE